MSTPHAHSQPYPPAASAHGRKRAQGGFDPGFSFLRSSLSARLAIVAVCLAVLWAAVFAVTA